MSDTIGARLRQARELRKLTLQQVSETTKLRIHYLEALESDDYSAIPSAAQARGFLRVYAGFLALDLGDLASSTVPAPSAAASEPAKPSLWDGLRERLKWHNSSQDPKLASSLASAAPEPAQPSEALPASSEVETTRRAKPASKDVKKNAA